MWKASIRYFRSLILTTISSMHIEHDTKQKRKCQQKKYAPEGRAVEVDEHELVRIEAERVGELHAAHQVAILGTDKGAARIGGVHVQPHVLAHAHRSDLFERVERADACRAQCRRYLQNETK